MNEDETNGVLRCVGCYHRFKDEEDYWLLMLKEPKILMFCYPCFGELDRVMKGERYGTPV